MAKISEMLPSNYLKQSDFPEDYVVTVRSIERKNIAMDGKPADYKWLAHYAEFEKPMVLNSTNIQLMSKACGSDDTDDWIGKQIIVYVDENVSFGGELVGGLRIASTSKPPRSRPRRLRVLRRGRWLVARLPAIPPTVPTTSTRSNREAVQSLLAVPDRHSLRQRSIAL
jgi:hypothetical protein